MTIYKLSYNKENFQWPEKEVTKKLEHIGALKDKKVAWIHLDLSTSKSNWLSRLIWTVVAKYFSWMRKSLYGVDLKQSRSLLKQIRHQIDSNSKLLELYKSAISKFNTIAPHHCIKKDAEETTPTTRKSDLQLKTEEHIEKAEETSLKDTPTIQEEEKEIVLPEKKKHTKVTEERTEGPTSELQTNKAATSSKITSVPDFIKSIVETSRCSAEQAVTVLTAYYEGQGNKLTEIQIKSIKIAAQQHIDRLRNEKKQKLASITLIQGSVTQFDKKFNGEGKSACTCINLKAAEEFVKGKSFENISTESLDNIIKNGIELWKDTTGKSKSEHLEVTQVDFGRLTLKIPEDYGIFGGYTKRISAFSSHKDFKTVLEECIQNHYKHYPYAVIFTKSPETASVIVRSENEFWLYDSHGNPIKERKAYVEKFSSLSAVSDALHERFPYVDPTNLGYGAGTLQDHQYNGFSAYILMKK